MSGFSDDAFSLEGLAGVPAVGDLDLAELHHVLLARGSQARLLACRRKIRRALEETAQAFPEPSLRASEARLPQTEQSEFER